MGVRDAVAKAFIKAFHSSPHDFDAFSRKAIGTGEGAQVYGHGIYAAENPAVSGQGGEYWNQFMRGSRFDPNEEEAASLLRLHRFDREAAIKDAAWNLNDLKSSLAEGELGFDRVTDPIHYADAQALYENLVNKRQAQYDLLTSGKPVGPRTYEISIKQDPVNFLDWFKPLNQQPGVINNMPSSMLDVASREAYVRSLASETKSRADQLAAMAKDPYQAPGEFFAGGTWKGPQAADTMEAAGIPGIRYLDQGSRMPQRPAVAQTNTVFGNVPILEHDPNPTKQTYNYVVFNPERDIDILKKYGVVGAPAGALGMGSAFDQDQYEAPP